MVDRLSHICPDNHLEPGRIGEESKLKSATAVIVAGMACCALASPAVSHDPEPEYLPLGAGNFPLSEAVQVGDVLYLSGQLGLAENGRAIVEGGIGPETTRTMERIGETLKKYDLDYSALFKCTVFLADMADFRAFNAEYAKFFGEGPFPARSALAAAGLAGNARVEVECIAWNPQG